MSSSSERDRQKTQCRLVMQMGSSFRWNPTIGVSLIALVTNQQISSRLCFGAIPDTTVPITAADMIQVVDTRRRSIEVETKRTNKVPPEFKLQNHHLVPGLPACKTPGPRIFKIVYNGVMCIIMTHQHITACVVTV